MDDVNKIKTKLLNIKKGSKILDVGCSYGEQSLMLAKCGFKVTGIDISKKLIKRLNEKSKKQKQECIGIRGNIEKMPFKSNVFDAVIATEIFEHVKYYDKAIGECYRVLKKEGRICVSVPTAFSEHIFSKLHPQWVKNSGHINVFSEREICNILTAAGFKILRIENQNFEWFIFWLIHSLLKSQFDDTGEPKENNWATENYFKIWSYLFKFKIGKSVMSIGNFLFPKSVYIYLIKP